MIALTFQIRLKQPLLISHMGTGDENSANALPYIPGSVIRGALIQRYVERHGAIEFGADQETEAQQLFFGARTAFLNGYPQTADGRRMLPRPLSWRIDKGMDITTTDIHDYALVADGLLDPKLPAKAFWTYTSTANPGEVALFDPARRVGMHNASDQRHLKRGDDSIVFRYDSLAEGQTFEGVILCDDRSFLEETILPLLDPGDMHIGRSRSAGYGWVQLERHRIEEPGWAEYGSSSAAGGRAGHGKVTLTLLSHTVLRDKSGRFTTDLACGLDLTVSPSAAFTSTDMIGGFNRTWGLPFTQMPVLCAGSVYVFDADSEFKSELEALVATGIGERRNEGFGRIAVNLNQQPVLLPRSLPRGSGSAQVVQLTGPSRTLATNMVERLYRETLDQKLMDLMSQSAMSLQKPPENSQLSQLRLVARNAWHREDLQVMLDHLDDLTSNAKAQYQKARIEKKTLYQWLSDGWNEHKLWSDYFHIRLADQPRIGDVRAEATDAIKIEYMARLVDALCNKRVKMTQAEIPAEVTR